MITGFGGMGKTELAIKFAKIYEDSFSFIWWIDSETTAGIEAGYRAIAAHLQVSFHEKDDLPIIQRQVHRFFETESFDKPWLVIFDNAHAHIDFPQEGNGRILVTSWTTDPWALYTKEPIDKLDRNESLLLLSGMLGQQSEELMDMLAEDLGDFPLALTQAVHFLLQNSRVSLSAYIAQLRKNTAEIVKRGMVADGHYPRSFIAVWELTWKSIQKVNGLASDWLKVCSLLSASMIPTKWMDIWLEGENSTGWLFPSKQMLTVLEGYGVVKVEKSGMIMHKLSQVVLASQLTVEEREITQGTAVHLLNRTIADFNITAVETWGLWGIWVIHAKHVMEKADNLKITPSSASVYSKCGQWASDRGYYQEAYDFSKKAYDTLKKLYGEQSHPDVADGLTVLGNAYHDLGEFQQALSHYEKALKIDEVIHGNQSHPDIAVRLNNMGMTYNNLGEFEKALFYLEKYLDMVKAIHGNQSHFDIAVGLNNVGMAYHSLGEFQKALSYLEDALQMDTVIHENKSHPDVARDLNNVGVIYLSLGKFQEALSYLKEALKMDTTINGNKPHPDVARELNHIGEVYKNWGKLQEALAYSEDALKMNKIIYANKPHPDVSAVLNNVGMVYNDLREFQKALSYLEDALQMDKGIYGNKPHPDIARSLSNMGILYKDWGKLEEALSHFKEALEMDKIIYGNKLHPDVAKRLNNTAIVCKDLGRLQEALFYFEEASKMNELLQKDKSLDAERLHEDFP